MSNQVLRFALKPLKKPILFEELAPLFFFSAYYRGAMGILLVYDVTDEVSFQDIHNWMKNIEQHASENVNKILIGNKCDMDSGKVGSFKRLSFFFVLFSKYV